MDRVFLDSDTDTAESAVSNQPFLLMLAFSGYSLAFVSLHGFWRRRAILSG
jgi:hypothetical protein